VSMPWHDENQIGALREVFQHRNIDRASTFTSLAASQADPKLVESFVEVVKGNCRAEVRKGLMHVGLEFCAGSDADD
jgi:hypothetical protein